MSETLSLNLLYDYYTRVQPHERVLQLCGAVQPNAPYTGHRDPDLTVIINGYARPDYLPLIWEATQYQTRRPCETWIVQNNPEGRSEVPVGFLEAMRRRQDTRLIDSSHGLNHGCWFRFLLAALYCRTKFVAIYDDDTLSGRMALETAIEDLQARPGIYGGRGITFRLAEGGPRFWDHDVHGWPVGTPVATQVDFVGHLWVTETAWLRRLFKHLPDRLFDSDEPGRECGEDMYLSFIAQRAGLPTLVFRHGADCNPRWSSIQAYEMGFHSQAMSSTGGLRHGDEYLRRLVESGWRLLRYAR
jgi:hypothetical protein